MITDWGKAQNEVGPQGQMFGDINLLTVYKTRLSVRSISKLMQTQACCFSFGMFCFTISTQTGSYSFIH